MRCCCGYLCYQGADCLHMIQLMPLHPKTPSSLAWFKSRLVLLFWYRLNQVVLEKRPLNRCSSYLLTYALVCGAGGGAGDECVAGDVQSWRRWASWAHQCGATDRSPGQHRAALGSQAVTDSDIYSHPTASSRVIIGAWTESTAALVQCRHVKPWCWSRHRPVQGGRSRAVLGQNIGGG